MKDNTIFFEDNNIVIAVDMHDDTVWLTQKQMAILFEKSQSSISEHINNVFAEKELIRESNIAFSDIANSDKPVTLYSLDVIISVGYRVKSKRGTEFRIWANKIVKEYLLKGYSVNLNRLEYLGKIINILDIANRIDDKLDDTEARSIIRVLDIYGKSLQTLDEYDKGSIILKEGTIGNKLIRYNDCIAIIERVKTKESNPVFAVLKEDGLKSIINNIYQTFDNKDLYPTIEEKAANLLYLVVKDHTFIDGNKRVAAILFIYFLNFYGILFQKNKTIFDHRLLTALTLLIAESNPNEKKIMTDLIMHFLYKE